MATPEAVLSSTGPSGGIKHSSPASLRRDSSSSRSSDAYSPLPPGRWNLNLHGNCSRCHHHHSFARFRVNIPSNPNVTTHVRCQGCHEKWLAIGGKNATQLSLLSVNSITPGPATDTVRYSLIKMVRTTTVLATLSPVLAGIAESPTSPTPSREHSMHITQVDETRGDTSSDFPQPSLLRPITTQKYGLLTARRFSNLKESIGMRFPAFHRANLRARFGITKPPHMSANRWGKQPISTPVAARSSTNPDLTLDLSLSGEVGKGDQPEGSLNRRPDPSQTHDSKDIASRFLQSLANDKTQLSSMTEKEKAAWVRAKYTEFKGHLDCVDDAAATSSDVPSVVDDLTSQLVQFSGVTPHQDRRLQDIFGLGSHLGAFDEFQPRNSFSISERTSEAETAVDDATAMFQPQYTLVDIMQGDRRGSGSPGSHAVTAFTLQRLRRGRREVGFSMDSAVTGEARRSSSRPRSATTDRYSQSSMIRTSMLSGTRLHMSQPSLASA